MVKKVFPFLVISAISLGACNPSSLSITSENEMVYASQNDISISFGMQKYALERGAYFVLKADVETSDDAISKNVIYSIEQDDNYVSVVESDDYSVTLVGKNIGKCKVVATCIANKDVTSTIEIEVIKHIPALNKVWQNINELNNYTLETSKTNGDENFLSSQIIINEKAILFESCVYDQESELYYNSPLYYNMANDAYILGYGIDQNEYAFPILMSSKGAFYLDNSIAKSERGFLTKDNFKGYKDDSESMNDVGIFYGLQAINSSWLPKSKAANNQYVFSLDTSDIQSCYVKYLLWGLIDPIGRFTYTNKHPEINDIINLTKKVEVMVKADSLAKVSFNLKYDESLFIDGDIENYVYHCEMKDIGSTTNDSISGLEEFISETRADYPPLVQEMQCFEDGIKKHNYIYKRDIYYKNPTTGSLLHSTFDIYYTEKYMMAYYSKDLCDLNEEMTGEKTTPFGLGYIKQEDGIHPFEYQPYQASKKIKIGDVISNTENVNVWDYDFNLTTEYKIPNYITNSRYYKDHSLNALSDYPSMIFKDMPSYHYSHNVDISKKFIEWFVGEEIESSDFYHGVHVNMSQDGTTLDSVSFLLAYEDEEYYHLLYTPTFSSFGKADKLNPANTYIQAYL